MMDFKLKKEDFYRAIITGVLYALLRFGMAYYREAAAFGMVPFLRDVAVGAAISLVLGFIFPKAR